MSSAVSPTPRSFTPGTILCEIDPKKLTLEEFMLPKPLNPDKINCSTSKSVEGDGNKSNLLSMPSNSSDDFIAFSNIPIKKVEATSENDSTIIEVEGYINLSLDASKPD